MKYPYYIVPDVEEYRKLDPNSEEAKRLCRKIAANIGDLASLRLIMGIDPPEFAKFYPDMDTMSPSTLDTIDNFLEKFGSKSPAGGYLAVDDNELPSEDDLHIGIAQDGINDLHYLVKDKRFADAISLIERQNLINPEKSIYFAHQIRFLKKLMAIEKFKNKTKD